MIFFWYYYKLRIQVPLSNFKFWKDKKIFDGLEMTRKVIMHVSPNGLDWTKEKL